MQQKKQRKSMPMRSIQPNWAENALTQSRNAAATQLRNAVIAAQGDVALALRILEQPDCRAPSFNLNPKRLILKAEDYTTVADALRAEHSDWAEAIMAYASQNLGNKWANQVAGDQPPTQGSAPTHRR
ncbi:MAG: hypothetical protein SFW64_08980 [Alphaproteobacteria bacterium]|nr:hypothetical protein [Alphaproteobacteria bacterium]